MTEFNSKKLRGMERSEPMTPHQERLAPLHSSSLSILSRKGRGRNPFRPPLRIGRQANHEETISNTQSEDRNNRKEQLQMKTVKQQETLKQVQGDDSTHPSSRSGTDGANQNHRLAGSQTKSSNKKGE